MPLFTRCNDLFIPEKHCPLGRDSINQDEMLQSVHQNIILCMRVPALTVCCIDSFLNAPKQIEYEIWISYNSCQFGSEASIKTFHRAECRLYVGIQDRMTRRDCFASFSVNRTLDQVYSRTRATAVALFLGISYRCSKCQSRRRYFY